MRSSTFELCLKYIAIKVVIKLNYILWPITKQASNRTNQSEHEANTLTNVKRGKTRASSYDWFCFESVEKAAQVFLF